MEDGALEKQNIVKGLMIVEPTVKGYKTHQKLTEQPVGLSAVQ